MSKGYTITRILLTVLLSFIMAAFILVSAAAPFFSNPEIYTDIIREEKLAEKAYAAIESDFKSQYNTTAVPAEVYMESIDTEWLEDEMCTRTDAYLKSINGVELDSLADDYNGLESNIESFFYEYAESIDYTPDEAFDEKLSEITVNAKETIDNRTDAFYLETISENSTVKAIAKYITAIKWALLGIVIIMMAALALLERKRNVRRIYWFGTGVFCGSILTAVPCVYLLCTNAVSSFSIKDPSTYAAVTNLLTGGIWSILTRSIVYGAIGTAIIAICIVMSRKFEKSEEHSK